MSLSTAARKFFAPSHHLWIRVANPNLFSIQPSPNETTTKQHQKNESTILMNVGLTPRGLEDIGDINIITSKFNVQDTQRINAGDDIVEIEWDGHVHTEADELYHAVWETFTKATIIPSPISGIIRNVQVVDRPSIHTVVDDETTLFSVEMDKSSFDNLSDTFVNEESYDKHVEKLPRGTFYDDRDL